MPMLRVVFDRRSCGVCVESSLRGAFTSCRTTRRAQRAHLTHIPKIARKVVSRQWQTNCEVHVIIRVDAAVKGRALPDDGKLNAKDAGDAGAAEDDVNSYLCSNSCARTHPLHSPLWTTLITTKGTPAAPAHGHRRRSTIARHLGSLPPAISPRLRCLRPRRRTARTLSNTDTWATTPNNRTDPALHRRRTAKRTQHRRSSSSRNNSNPAKMRRSCLNTQTPSSQLLSKASSRKDTMEHVRSASSSTTSSRRRSQDSSATARRTP